jgi:hypothetical protein
MVAILITWKPSSERFQKDGVLSGSSSKRLSTWILKQ